MHKNTWRLNAHPLTSNQVHQTSKEGCLSHKMSGYCSSINSENDAVFGWNVMNLHSFQQRYIYYGDYLFEYLIVMWEGRGAGNRHSYNLEQHIGRRLLFSIFIIMTQIDWHIFQGASKQMLMYQSQRIYWVLANDLGVAFELRFTMKGHYYVRLFFNLWKMKHILQASAKDVS